MQVDIDDEFIEQLKKLAASDSVDDKINDDDNDDMVDDYAGGNIDDAYSIGYDSGEIQMARDVLAAMKIKWEGCE